MKSRSTQVILPADLPILFSIGSNGRVQLPATLPFRFNLTNGKVNLPARLPFRFDNIINRKISKIPYRVTCEYVPTNCFTKLKVSRVAITTQIKLPILKTAWDFKGLILEENVVAKMSKQITLLEEVRARILVDVELIDKNHIKLKWYGDSVPKLSVMKKVFVDEDFTNEGTYNWDDGEATIIVDSNEYNVQLIGLNGTGESGVIDLGESSEIDVLSNVKIALNEKIYDVNVDYSSEYHININY